MSVPNRPNLEHQKKLQIYYELNCQNFSFVKDIMAGSFGGASDFFRGINIFVKNDSSRTICLVYNTDILSDLKFFIKLILPNNSLSPTLVQYSGALLSAGLDSSFPEGYVKINSLPFFGLLGVIQIDQLPFILVISRATPVAVSIGDPIFQINHVEAISLLDEKYDLLSPVEWTTTFIEEPMDKSASCVDILRVLSDQSFYFSFSSNLSLFLQYRSSIPQKSPYFSKCESHFCWNEYFFEPFSSFFKDSIHSIDDRLLEAFSSPPFRVHIIRGYVGQFILNKQDNASLELSEEVEVPLLDKTTSKKYSINSMVKSGISSAFKIASTKFFSSTSFANSGKKLSLPSLNISLDDVDSFSFDNETVLLISRVGRKRAGTRFLTRGVDDDGNTAIFVESEFIFETREKIASFISIRGSVPVFWEQQGFQFGNPKIQFTRSLDASDFSFKEHFFDLLKVYGAPICIVNLLSSNINCPENALSRRYYRHVQLLSKVFQHDEIKYLTFDVNSALDGLAYDYLPSILSSIITEELINEIGVFLFDKKDSSIISQQKGIFRINCLDCLDRTNVVQTIITKMVLSHVTTSMVDRKLPGNSSSTFNSNFNSLWADNGDTLSLLYTGTGALKSSFTRTGKRTFAGIVDDIKKSTHRFYVNNFQDKYRQKLIDFILGKGISRIHFFPEGSQTSSFVPLLASHAKELENIQYDLLIFSCTFNVGGQSPEYINFGILLRPLWKLKGKYKALSLDERGPDIFAISLQEAIELSPSQVLTSDDISLASLWEEHIGNYLSSFFPKMQYSVLSSIQMVGLVLIIIVAKPLLPNIKRVERFAKKTGFGGVTGNKGSISMRFDLEPESSFCFVNSHFSSGQENVTIRNREYFSIYYEMQFPSGLSVDCHSYPFFNNNDRNVIWMGDLNYRIDIGAEALHQEVLTNELLLTLRCHDQLSKEKEAGAIFENFEEGKIHFPPTYKYLLNSDQYDLNRVPGWTDRILYSSKKLRLLDYTSLEDIMISDHRPVLAIWRYNQDTTKEDKELACPVVKKLIEVDDPFQVVAQEAEITIHNKPLINSDKSWEDW